jgi:hypothetical protein
MQLENQPDLPVIPACGVSLLESDTVEEQVLAFLDGRTHGEGLLHGLYDYVLEEPVPERMQALLRAGRATLQRQASTQG